MQNPHKYGFMLNDKDYFPPFENYEIVKIHQRHIEWSDFAARHKTNYRILRILNPWIRSYSYENRTAKTYEVKVPNEKFKILGY